MFFHSRNIRIASLGARTLLAAVLALASTAAAARRPDRPLDIVRSLDLDLRSRDSATATLALWCGRLGLASPAAILAVRAPGPAEPAPTKVRRRLGAGASTPIRYRHVRLVCGGHVLSDARNWYRPDRLTPAMNQTLETTETPFGVVVAPLEFHRIRLGSRILLAPGAARIPPIVLRQSGVLISGAGAPFAFVDERYSRDLVTAVR